MSKKQKITLSKKTKSYSTPWFESPSTKGLKLKMKTTIKEKITVSRNLATLKNCEICGKIISKDSCKAYCSYACCLQAIDNMVCALGGFLEDAEKEIRSLCECVY